jgi:hypothetical protein
LTAQSAPTIEGNTFREKPFRAVSERWIGV